MNVNRKKATLGILSAVAVVSAAHAQLYVEGSYMNLASRATGSAGTTEANGSAVAGILGYGFHPNFSVEGMIGTGLTNADVKLNGATQATPVTQKLDHSAGVLIRAKASLSDSVDVFARVGRVEWRTTATAGAASAAANLTDWMYSVGLNYKISKSVYLTGSWISLYSKDNIKGDGWAVGLGYQF